MIYENLDGDILTTIKTFPRFDDTQLDKYMLKMYSKQYLKWNVNACQMPKSDGTTEHITPQHVQKSIDSAAKRVMRCTIAIYWFISFMVYAQLCEAAMLHMHKNEALGKSKMDKIQYTRRTLTITFELVCVLCLYLIYQVADDRTISFLARHNCSFDDSVNNSFAMINNYFLQSGSRMCINLAFLALILLADIAGLLEKYLWEKQARLEGGQDLEIKPNTREPMLEMTTNTALN